MVIRQSADDLIVRLKKIHDEEIDTILHDYLETYADYGWDSFCTALSVINANIDDAMTQLKHARIEGSKYL